VAKLNIPERYRTGVSAIRTLDSQSVQAIKAALEGTGHQKTDDMGAVQGTLGDMAITAITSIHSPRPAEFKQIGEALVSLYGAKSARDVSIEDFAEEVCEAMESIPEENLRLSHTERAQFKEKLLTLLNADVFGFITKIRDLTIEHERTFCHARIMTDMRPVFDSRIEDGPRAILVTHLLRLAYHEGSEKPKDFYVSLDANDLRTLRQLIDRAEAKAKALRSAAKDVRIFGVPKE
jgi:hypothetical protein